MFSASVSTQSCHDKLVELFSEKLYLIGLAALVVAVIMVSVRSKCKLSVYRRWDGRLTRLFCLHLDLRDDLHDGAVLWDP